MSQTLLAIDPGKKYLGWCWIEKSELRAVGVSSCTAKDPRIAAHLHREALAQYLPCRVVCEMMQFDARSRGKEKDILGLQLIAGFVGTEWYTPQEWKGSTGRGTEQERTWAKLSERERALLRAVGPLTKTGKVHNAWSAVGLAMKVLARRADLSSTGIKEST